MSSITTSRIRSRSSAAGAKTPEPGGSPRHPSLLRALAVQHGFNRTTMLVMPVIFQDISTSRGGCFPVKLEASKCLCSILA
jgi:hypothetical protein